MGKRSRVELAPEYRERYIEEILDHVDLLPIVEAMPPDARATTRFVEFLRKIPIADAQAAW